MNTVTKQLHPLHKQLHRHDGPLNKTERGRIVQIATAQTEQEHHVFLVIVEKPEVWRRALKINSQDPNAMIDATLQYGDETNGLAFLPLDALPEEFRKPWEEAAETKAYESARLHTKERRS